MLGQSLGKRNRIIKISQSLIKKLAAVGDVLNLPLNSERLQKLTENYVVSNEKIKMALGKDLPVSSRKGLITTFTSFKN